MIAIGCDHGGFDLKQAVIAYLEENHLAYKDFGWQLQQENAIAEL